MVHNNVPCTAEEKSFYYSSLFDVWFPADLMPKGMDRNATNATFMQGGYYRYDFDDSNLTLLALNTMFFKDDNKCALEDGSEQLDWLEA